MHDLLNLELITFQFFYSWDRHTKVLYWSQIKLSHAQEHSECWTHPCFRRCFATCSSSVVSYCLVVKHLILECLGWQDQGTANHQGVTYSAETHHSLSAIRSRYLRIMPSILLSLPHHGIAVFWANQLLRWGSSALAGCPVDGESQAELTECELETTNQVLSFKVAEAACTALSTHQGW